MSDFGKYSPFEPPTVLRERQAWLIEQEERIARRTRRAIVKVVEQSTNEFLDTLTASGDMGVFDRIPASWMIYVDDYLLDELQGMYLSGGLTAWITTVGDRLPDTVALRWVDVVNNGAAEYAKVARNRMSDVGLTTWNTVKDKVSTSIVRGRSIEETKQDIERVTGFSEFRADTIARTETISAFVNGDWQSMNALEEFRPTHKYWMATGGPRGRPEHTAVDGQVLLIDELFDVGGEQMMAPHDMNASAANVVNCRCGVGYLYPGESDPTTGEPIEVPEGWVDPFGGGGGFADFEVEIFEPE